MVETGFNPQDTSWGLALNASAAKSATAWKSMLMTEVLAWFHRGDVVGLQRLCKFWYDKAVSRVQTRLQLPKSIIFATGDY